MQKDFYVICDNIRSLENIGSVFRTADAMGVAKIYLCGISGCPPHQKISKTALGAENDIPWEYHKQTWRLIESLKKQGVQIIALEQDKNAKDIKEFLPKFPLVLIIGNEVNGVSKNTLAKCDDIVELQMRGKKESLNVSVAFGIAAYAITQK